MFMCVSFQYGNPYIFLNTPKNLPGCPADTKPLYEAALAHIRASRLTDAELIYTPSQIALAAFSLAAPDLAQQWIKAKLAPDSRHSSLSHEGLSTVTEKIKLLITSEGHPPDVEAVRDVDRRLKTCKNPEKVVGSQAYLAKKAEQEKKAEDKRQKKAEEANRAMTEGDPFGTDLVTRPSLVNYDDEDDEE
jgi:cyclin H